MHSHQNETSLIERSCKDKIKVEPMEFAESSCTSLGENISVVKKSAQSNCSEIPMTVLYRSEEQKAQIKVCKVESPSDLHKHMSKRKRDEWTSEVQIGPSLRKQFQFKAPSKCLTIHKKMKYSSAESKAEITEYWDNGFIQRFYPTSLNSSIREINANSEDQTLLDGSFCKDDIKIEPTEFTESTCTKSTNEQASIKDNEDQTSFVESLCENEIKIEPTELTEYTWTESTNTQPSSEDNEYQTSLIESLNKETVAIEQTTKSIAAESLKEDNGDEADHRMNPKINKKRRFLSEEDKVQIRAYKEAGHTIYYIARKIGRNYSTVYFFLKQPRKDHSLHTIMTEATLDKALHDNNADQPSLFRQVKKKTRISKEKKTKIPTYEITGHSNPEKSKFLKKPSPKKRKKMKSKKNSLSEEDKAYIISSKAAGVSSRDIGAKLGRHRVVINHFLRRIKKDYVPPVRYQKIPQELLKKKRITEEEKDQIRAYKNHGLSHCEIARRIGRPHQTVSRHLYELNKSQEEIIIEKGIEVAKEEISEDNEDQTICEDKVYVKLTSSTKRSSNAFNHDNEDQLLLYKNFSEAKIKLEPMSLVESKGGISSDAQALKRLKWLQEYSILKENFRATGIIAQLKQLYKGELES